MMRAENDWRLTNQESYLKGVTLIWRSYAPARAGNDHDHCEFCWGKFMSMAASDMFHEGYSTLDGYRWICKDCYEDFADLFGWEVQRGV